MVKKYRENDKIASCFTLERNSMSSIFAFFRLFFLAFVCLSTPLIFAGVVIEKIYYFVDDAVITKIDFDLAMRQAKKFSNNDNLSKKKLSNTVMSNLILDMLIEKKAEEEGIYSTETDIINRIKIIMESNGIATLEDFTNALAVQGVDYTAFTNKIHKTLLIENTAQRVNKYVEPSAEEIKKYYEKEKNRRFVIKEPIHRVSYLEWKLPANSSLSQKAEAQKKLQKITQEIKEKKLTVAEYYQQLSKKEKKKINFSITGWTFLSTLRLSPKNISEISVLPLSTMKNAGGLSRIMPSPKGIAIYQLLEIKRKGYIPYDLAYKMIEKNISSERYKKNIKTLIENLFKTAYIKANVDLFSIDALK